MGEGGRSELRDVLEAVSMGSAVGGEKKIRYIMAVDETRSLDKLIFIGVAEVSLNFDLGLVPGIYCNKK